MSAAVIPVTLAVREVTEDLPANVFIAPNVVASAATVPRFTVIALPVPVAFVNSLLSSRLEPAISSIDIVTAEPSLLANSINLFISLMSAASVMVIMVSEPIVSTTSIAGCVVFPRAVVRFALPAVPLVSTRLERLSLIPLSLIV